MTAAGKIGWSGWRRWRRWRRSLGSPVALPPATTKRRSRAPMSPRRPRAQGETPQEADAQERRLQELPHRHRRADHARSPRRSCWAAPTATAATRAVTAPAGPGRRPIRTMPRCATGPTSCRAIRRAWHFPSSANPKQSYTLLNREAPEFVRFVNPSDYRVVRESCGACHMELIEAAERSLMATGAMFCGGASYNNGILPVQELHPGRGLYRATASRREIAVAGRSARHGDAEQKAKRGALPALYPLPTWQVMPPADIFRVFERGGRNIGTQFAGDRPARRDRRSAAAGGARPARHPPVQPRPGHRPARRDPDAQHPQDPPERPLHLVHGHQRPAGRLSPVGLRRAATWSTPTTASRAHSLAYAQVRPRRPERDASTRPSTRPSPAIRSSTPSPARSRPRSA